MPAISPRERLQKFFGHLTNFVKFTFACVGLHTRHSWIFRGHCRCDARCSWTVSHDPASIDDSAETPPGVFDGRIVFSAWDSTHQGKPPVVLRRVEGRQLPLAPMGSSTYDV